MAGVVGTDAHPRKPLSLESRRLRIVLATVFLNVAAVTVFVFAPWSNWRTGLALNLFDNLILGFFAWRERDGVLVRYLLYGLVVGLAELPADAWLVLYTHTLDYTIGGGPMLWMSPLWMPLAWQVVTVQFAVIGERWMQWRTGLGLLFTGVLGAVNIPYYEEMARRIQWWRYSDCRMISGTPYYIIVGEFSIAILLAWLARYVARGPAAILPAGIAAGAGITLSYMAAFALTDRLL